MRLATKKQQNKVKRMKKTSRELYSDYGKAGVHEDETEKRKQKKSTRDYLTEAEEEETEENE